MTAQPQSQNGGMHSGKCQHPFRSHPIHGRVFAPWGVFGNQYRIDSEVQYERLRKTVPSFYCFFGLLNMPHCLGGLLHLGWVGQCVLGFGMFFGLIALCASIIRRESRNLTVVVPRLTFRRALINFSRESPLWVLWLGNIIALLIAATLREYALAEPVNSLVEWLLIGVFLLLALAFSGVIFVKQFTPPIDTRQSMRC